MNKEYSNILNSHTSGELYRALRLWLNKNKGLIEVHYYKECIDLVIEIIHKKVGPFFCAIVNDEFISGKISLEKASIKLDYFEKIYNI